jgi:hypothetical protein
MRLLIALVGVVVLGCSVRPPAAQTQTEVDSSTPTATPDASSVSDASANGSPDGPAGFAAPLPYLFAASNGAGDGGIALAPGTSAVLGFGAIIPTPGSYALSVSIDNDPTGLWSAELKTSAGLTTTLPNSKVVGTGVSLSATGTPQSTADVIYLVVTYASVTDPTSVGHAVVPLNKL